MLKAEILGYSHCTRHRLNARCYEIDNTKFTLSLHTDIYLNRNSTEKVRVVTKTTFDSRCGGASTTSEKNDVNGVRA